MFLFKYNFPSPKLLLMSSRFFVLRQQAVGLMRVWCKQWRAVFSLKRFGASTGNLNVGFQSQLDVCSVVWHQANCSFCLWLIWFVFLSYIRGVKPTNYQDFAMQKIEQQNVMIDFSLPISLDVAIGYGWSGRWTWRRSSRGSFLVKALCNTIKKKSRDK